LVSVKKEKQTPVTSETPLSDKKPKKT